MKAHLKRLFPLAAVIFLSLRPIMAADKVTLVMWHNHRMEGASRGYPAEI
jgi:hypothetical protein